MRVTWTGGPVIGGGVSTFYLNAPHIGGTSALSTWFGSIANFVPLGVTFAIPNSGDIIDSASGALTGTWTDGTATFVTGLGNAKWVSGTGMRVTWRTAGIRNRRRVTGSTFIVPITAASFDTDGSIDPAVMTLVNSASSALLGSLSPDFVVWSRPHEGTSDGIASQVQTFFAPDKVSWLRSRRT